MTQPPQAVARAKAKPTPSNAEKHKSTTARASQPQNANVKLKVVVRGLPPNLPETKFNQVTAEWINQGTVEWYYYVGGKLHERGNKPSVRSRAYAKFKTVDALATFHKAFNGHVFTDSRGRSSRAMIEFAPFQKYVKGKQKQDTRQGTIDSAPEYKEFLDSLAHPAPAETVVVADNEHITTPLIEYLRTQKAAKAEKERLNREKLKAAKVAALQAKANAQSEKLKSEKTQKVIAGTSKSSEQAREVKQIATRGRGAKAVAKAAQRARAQHQGVSDKTDSTATISTSVPAVRAPEASATSIDVSAGTDTGPSTVNTASQQAFRGRGRGGRARPRGIYRPGAGRGARRGGIGNETKPTSNTAEGG